MVSVISLLIVIALSMLVIRIGAVALLMTGLSEEVAKFQSLSAFSGTGFTTTESESILNVPIRRKIITLLIRLGSVGVVTSISTLLLSFVGAGQATSERLIVLLIGVGGLYFLSRNKAFNRVLTPMIEKILSRYTSLDLRDYVSLLHLKEDYRIAEIDIREHAWLADKTIEELDLVEEGVLVLGVKRTGEEYVGVPPADLRLKAKDLLIIYGKKNRLDELSKRESGNEEAHDEAKAQNKIDQQGQRRQTERMNKEE
ncbi:TrkA-C domain-containing protein [Salinimicrobium catena]|uniref:TrkA-C domain-containing protein n=1 Tax=Salinimicrobium catena TaxID=390640 RepID=A0A1H5PA84_9FLAO|nr:TrkA C-terminal domain-containing protein [Salinimicrobium catena]SDL75372.1 TrkA-C domain-containing protein [Salinimicrobium catena]SEF09971.1 TrkA-C domain-containing protein [Salinimicrobium catena]